MRNFTTVTDEIIRINENVAVDDFEISPRYSHKKKSIGVKSNDRATPKRAMMSILSIHRGIVCQALPQYDEPNVLIVG